MRRRTGLAIAGVAALVWGEWLNWRWSRAVVGSSGGASAAVVVLGYRNPQATANLINRWRVRAGIRFIGADGAHGTCVIFSGGATSSGATEAHLMADYAKSVLEFDGTVLLEDQSATTWENIVNVIPLLEDVDRIKIASQPAHALKARAYLRRQRPDLADRLARADDYRPGEWMFVKPVVGSVRTLDTPRPQGRRAEGLAVDSRRRLASGMVVLEPTPADDAAPRSEEGFVDAACGSPSRSAGGGTSAGGRTRAPRASVGCPGRKLARCRGGRSSVSRRDPQTRRRYVVVVAAVGQ